MRIKEEIKRLDNFPVDGESYVLGLTEDNKYFFAWGSEIPYSEEIPNESILDGANGIEFFNTLEEAENRFNDTINAWEVKKMKKRVFQTAEVGGYKFAILLDDEDKRAYEAVWTENGWETDFSYPALGIDSFDVAGALDFDAVKEMGYTFVE